MLELIDQYVGALGTLPEPGESEGGTCRHAGCALAGEVDRVFGQREDGRISPEQLRDLAEDALAKISIPEKSWVRECDECAFCPHTIPEFSRDWTREDWILRNGGRLRPDGTVVPATKFSKPLG